MLITLIEKPPYKEDCPFCQGNEHLTPYESLAYRSGGAPDTFFLNLGLMRTSRTGHRNMQMQSC